MYEVCAQSQKIAPFAIQTTAHGNRQARFFIEAQLRILQEFYESKYESIYTKYFFRFPSAIQKHVHKLSWLAKISESVQVVKSDDYGNVFELMELEGTRGEMYAICRNTEVRTQLETADGRAAMLHAITIPNYPKISISEETKSALVSAITDADASLPTQLLLELGTEVVNRFLSETMQNFERTMDVVRDRLEVFCFNTDIVKNRATAAKCKQLPQTEKKYHLDIKKGINDFRSPYIQHADFRNTIIDDLINQVNIVLKVFNSQVEGYIMDRQRLMYELTH